MVSVEEGSIAMLMERVAELQADLEEQRRLIGEPSKYSLKSPSVRQQGAGETTARATQSHSTAEPFNQHVPRPESESSSGRASSNRLPSGKAPEVSRDSRLPPMLKFETEPEGSAMQYGACGTSPSSSEIRRIHHQVSTCAQQLNMLGNQFDLDDTDAFAQNKQRHVPSNGVALIGSFPKPFDPTAWESDIPSGDENALLTRLGHLESLVCALLVDDDECADGSCKSYLDGSPSDSAKSYLDLQRLNPTDVKPIRRVLRELQQKEIENKRHPSSLCEAPGMQAISAEPHFAGHINNFVHGLVESKDLDAQQRKENESKSHLNTFVAPSGTHTIPAESQRSHVSSNHADSKDINRASKVATENSERKETQTLNVAPAFFPSTSSSSTEMVGAKKAPWCSGSSNSGTSILAVRDRILLSAGSNGSTNTDRRSVPVVLKVRSEAATKRAPCYSSNSTTEPRPHDADFKQGLPIHTSNVEVPIPRLPMQTVQMQPSNIELPQPTTPRGLSPVRLDLTPTRTPVSRPMSPVRLDTMRVPSPPPHKCPRQLDLKGLPSPCQMPFVSFTLRPSEQQPIVQPTEPPLSCLARSVSPIMRRAPPVLPDFIKSLERRGSPDQRDLQIPQVLFPPQHCHTTAAHENFLCRSPTLSAAHERTACRSPPCSASAPRALVPPIPLTVRERPTPPEATPRDAREGRDSARRSDPPAAPPAPPRRSTAQSSTTQHASRGQNAPSAPTSALPEQTASDKPSRARKSSSFIAGGGDESSSNYPGIVIRKVAL